MYDLPNVGEKNLHFFFNTLVTKNKIQMFVIVS